MKLKALATALFAPYFVTIANPEVALAGGPKFVDYAVPVHTGPKAPFRLDGIKPKFVSQLGPYLQRAYAGSVNFAGHYVFVPLDVGGGCVSAFALDVKTGLSIGMDASACHWQETDTTPFYFKPYSKLLVLSGSVGSNGLRGAHYFILDNGVFKTFERYKQDIIASNDVDLGSIEPASNPFGTGNSGPEIDNETNVDERDKSLGDVGLSLNKIEPAAGNASFDENGNLNKKASMAFFEKISESLVEATGDKKYIADPFPEMFMSSGYFRKENGLLLFINPTFGMLVLFEDPKKPPHAIGVTELFSIIDKEPKGEKSNIKARYVYFNEYINRLLLGYSLNRKQFSRSVARTYLYRDRETNKVFLSDPVMRAVNPEVRSCYADFPVTRYAAKIDGKLQSELGTTDSYDFQPVDLVPLPDDEGVLILTDSRSRSLYALIPLKRSGGHCTFSEPSFVLQD